MRLKALSLMVAIVPLVATGFTAGSGSWTTASMLTPRESQSAVQISATELLVTGGEGLGTSFFGDVIASSESYNLKSNAWRFVGSMSTARVGQIAVRLGNGDVLVAGGQDTGADPLQTAETFSPRSYRWSLVASMPKPAAEQAAVILPDGQVLVTGGIVAGKVSSQALLYNYRTNSWHFAAPMHHARAAHASLLLPDGEVLVAGGSSPYAEIYQPKLNRWIPAGRPGERLFPAAMRVGTSDVLLAGGKLIDGGCLASATLYLGGSRWISVSSMESRRCSPLSTSLPNGRALVGGGFDSTTSSTIQEFDPRPMRWLPFPSLPGPRAAGTLTYMDGSIIAAGGTVEGDEIQTSVTRRISG